jgi:hypothetical protein
VQADFETKDMLLLVAVTIENWTTHNLLILDFTTTGSMGEPISSGSWKNLQDYCRQDRLSD